VQAILVRPIEEGNYEIVFGHRRHRACLELGIPVLAAIYTKPLLDLDLFAMMDRENRERDDLSPYEQGTMYRRALDGNLFPSQRRLAEALGVSHTWVGKTIVVADLPGAIVECFRNPLDIQHRHAEQISNALETDRKGVLRRAEKLRQTTQKPGPAAVVAALLGNTGQGGASPKSQPLLVAGKQAGKWARTKEGGVTITLDAGVVPDGRLEETMAAVAQALIV
jgi:ParB family transcriptional regulator, chromosome partitioning protein